MLHGEKIYALLFFLLAFSLAVHADMKEHQEFFVSKAASIMNWLESCGLGKVLEYSSMDVQPESVTVNFKVPFREAWEDADSRCIKAYDQTLETILFNKLLFLLNLKSSELLIEADAPLVTFQVHNTPDGPEVMMLHKHGAHSGMWGFQPVNLTVLRHHGNVLTRKSRKEIKQILAKGLEIFFEQYGDDSNSFRFRELNDFGKTLVFEVYNIKGAVPEDRDSFEYLRLSFRFDRKDQDFAIDYEVLGKYGSETLFNHRQEDYFDMDPDYAAALDDFVLILGKEISRLL